mmetsp:Transcript_39137/g.155124  ORF Transcript_39137/g.155124 Transcript_39137/m.155124 type:complete len:124 (-) Transcript_39137:3016-3387(-)
MKLMKRRDRHALVDDAYNRYAFDDPGGLPNWFADEDERSRQRIIPATKEEVEEMKARYVNANRRSEHIIESPDLKISNEIRLRLQAEDARRTPVQEGTRGERTQANERGTPTRKAKAEDERRS